LFSRTILLQKL